MPTGAITWELVIWLATVLVGAISGASAVIGIGWRVYRGVVAKVELVDARAKAAEDALADALSKVQVHAAETYATKSGVTAAVERVEGAVERLTSQMESAVDRLSGRIDRLLEVPPSTRRRSPP